MHCILKDLAKFFIHCYSKQTTILIDIYICFSFSEPCHPYEPFKCPGDGNCISIQYLCDGAPDCSDGYDEDARLCTAGNFFFASLFILREPFYDNDYCDTLSYDDNIITHGCTIRLYRVVCRGLFIQICIIFKMIMRKSLCVCARYILNFFVNQCQGALSFLPSYFCAYQ